jgi:drug/metabolite transporter (DMT)-like permease
MLVGSLLGIEPLTARKSAGVGLAVVGVIAALASGLSAAPPGAWRGELNHDRGRPLHGFLQCLGPPVHPAIERSRISHRRHGSRRAVLILFGLATDRLAVLGRFAAVVIADGGRLQNCSGTEPIR